MESKYIVDEKCRTGLGQYTIIPKIKTTSNNEFIIVPTVERMYSRDEVRLLICNYAFENSLGWSNGMTTDKWIEENLI